MQSNISYHRASSDDELIQILNLQKKNLKQVLSEEDKKKEGFVSVDHTFEVLKAMNTACPHCIAKEGNTVVGYALCMLNEFRNDVPELVPMFNYMDSILDNKGLSSMRYFIMGQICIDSNYRRKGIFRGLYDFLKKELAPDFDAVVTEVNAKNIRSSEAHMSVGFQLLDKHTEDGEDWQLIMMYL